MAARITTGLLVFGALAVAADTEPRQPIYRITVVSNNLKAINYGYKAPPVETGLKGTVLLPEASGRASVRVLGGVTELDVRVSGLTAPSRFDPRLLTYVLWAVTPQGRPVSLGELIPNRADKARLKVSTPLQSFALIVTAEPYFAVTKPGGVVVLENTIPTGGNVRIEDVQAKEELYPSQEFTYSTGRPEAPGPMVSMDEYEAMSALYQAQNAVQIARAEGADRAAPDSFARAEQLYRQALACRDRKDSHKRVAMVARQAAQAAEDARAVAGRRMAANEGVR